MKAIILAALCFVAVPALGQTTLQPLPRPPGMPGTGPVQTGRETESPHAKPALARPPGIPGPGPVQTGLEPEAPRGTLPALQMPPEMEQELRIRRELGK